MAAAICDPQHWGYDMSTIIAGLAWVELRWLWPLSKPSPMYSGAFRLLAIVRSRWAISAILADCWGRWKIIGMRSTRVRTLNRTLVSVPNTAFAGMNLENYSLRDKILFNPTVQVKRTSPKEQIRHCMRELSEMLANHNDVELGRSPVRISSYNSASFGLRFLRTC